MNPRRILAIARKEVLHILRDRMTLGMVIGMPVMMMLAFGYAVSTDVSHVPAGVWDQDGSAAGRELVAKLEASRYFDFSRHVSSEGELRRLMDRGKIRAGLIIPPGYAADLAAGRTARVLLLVDGSDPLVASTALPAAQLVAQVHGARLLAGRLEETGAAGPVDLPLEMRFRVWYNPDLESRRFNLPGLVGVIMQNTTIILTAFAMVRERERGTIEQLIVTPVRPMELMLGKLAPYVVLGFTALGLSLGLTVFWFGVEPSGSLALLLGLSAIFLVCALGIGLFISTVARNQLQAMQLSQFMLLPSFILSGFIFPRESMPDAVGALSYTLPLVC